MHILFVHMVKFKFFWHNSQYITLPTQSCLLLRSFCANLLSSLIMWLVVSSLSPHSLYLLFCCVLSILALIWLVLMALFCAAIRRNFIYHLIYQPLRSGRIWHKVNFLSGNQSVQLFTHSWRENNWIHTFPKDISAMWNAINLVQDLNSSRRVHFLQR